MGEVGLRFSFRAGSPSGFGTDVVSAAHDGFVRVSPLWALCKNFVCKLRYFFFHIFWYFQKRFGPLIFSCYIFVFWVFSPLLSLLFPSFFLLVYLTVHLLTS